MADGIEKEFWDDGESKRESKRCSHLGKEVLTLKKQWNVARVRTFHLVVKLTIVPVFNLSLTQKQIVAIMHA